MSLLLVRDVRDHCRGLLESGECVDCAREGRESPSIWDEHGPLGRCADCYRLWWRRKIGEQKEKEMIV